MTEAQVERCCEALEEALQGNWTVTWHGFPTPRTRSFAG